jgi:hypothetical protein
MPPRSTGTRSVDDYAAHRCPRCRHLKYAGEKPEDPCLAAVVYDPPRCDCVTFHGPQASAGKP